jgi:hypothetical protein
MAWGHSPYCGDRKNNRSVFSKEAKKVYQKLDETTSRKTLIEAGNKGLLNALLKHFAMREKEPRKNSGFPCFGQQYPKRYFWRGTRGLSVSEKTRITLSSPSRMEGQVSRWLTFAFSLTPGGHWLPSLIAAANYKKRLKDGSEKKGFGLKPMVNLSLLYRRRTINPPFSHFPPPP